MPGFKECKPWSLPSHSSSHGSIASPASPSSKEPPHRLYKAGGHGNEQTTTQNSNCIIATQSPWPSPEENTTAVTMNTWCQATSRLYVASLGRRQAGRQAGSKAGRQAGRDRTSLSCPCHNVKYRVRVLSLSLLGNGFCSSYTGSDHSNRKYNRRLYSDVNAKRLI